VGLRVGVERHVCLACIAKSKTRSEQKRVIQSDQDVQACGLYLVIHGLTLLHDSFSFDISNCGLSLFSSLFLTCLCKHVFGYASFLFFFDILHEHVVYLLWVDIFYFLFCIAQVVLESEVIEFLFLWMDVATISQCGSIVCVRDLDQESMTSF